MSYQGATSEGLRALSWRARCIGCIRTQLARWPGRQRQGKLPFDPLSACVTRHSGAGRGRRPELGPLEAAVRLGHGCVERDRSLVSDRNWPHAHIESPQTGDAILLLHDGHWRRHPAPGLRLAADKAVDIPPAVQHAHDVDAIGERHVEDDVASEREAPEVGGEFRARRPIIGCVASVASAASISSTQRSAAAGLSVAM
jgi:hypothetical protein